MTGVVTASVRAALTPNTRNDAWAMLPGLTVSALVLAVLWRALVRTGPFARGPLEGVVERGVRAAQRHGAGPSEPAGVGSPAAP